MKSPQRHEFPDCDCPSETLCWAREAAEVRAANPQPSSLPAAQQAEPLGWRSALEFYATRCHFMLANEDAWDTVSGEPSNFWCDEEGTATVEDGTVAARALAGDPLPDEDEDAAHNISAAPAGEGETR